MSEEKKVVTLLNRSKRHYDTANADGKAVRHSPGFTEEYTSEQAAQFDPREMVDTSKLGGSVDKEALRKENATLKAEKLALEAKLAALTPSAPAEEAAAAGEDASLAAADAEAGSGAGDGKSGKKGRK